MNQFDATKLQQVQQQMEAQRIQDEAAQIEMRRARLVQGAQEALALPESRRTPFLVGVANEIDPSGEFARDFLDMQANNPAEVQATLQRLSDIGKEQGMTEYQRQSLKLEEQRLNKVTDERTQDQKNLAEYQRLRKTDPEAAEMFARASNLLPEADTISSKGETELINTQNAYVSANAQAREYELLADDFDNFKGSLPSGVAGTVTEFLTYVAGSQGDASELRRRLAKVRLSEGLKYLPPGPATDRDVEEAFKAVPPENASPEQVKRFLRGAAKLARIDADYLRFKEDYISRNENTKGLNAAWEKALKSGEVESVNALVPKTDRLAELRKRAGL